MQKNQIIKKEPDMIYRDGKASAVILDINEYQDMVEQLKDFEEIVEHIEIAGIIEERLKGHNIGNDIPWKEIKMKYGL